MKKIIILGAGLIGKPMFLDLLADGEYQLALADRDEAKLLEISRAHPVETCQVDLSIREKVRETISPYDLVINAVPGFMGYRTLETILDAGKNVVDIAFSPEDLNTLDKLAKDKQVTALVDFGVAPGLSHLVAGYISTFMDAIEYLRIYVGGLPRQRIKPFEYKAVFSPADVIEEYTRPARLVRNGKPAQVEALTEIEELFFDRVGTLEAFNSDGLRSLVHSIPGKDMAEKTLRYPGHAAIMKLFRDTGFFSQIPVELDGHPVRPLDLTARLLFPKWQWSEGDEDITVMKIVASGLQQNRPLTYVFDLYDEYDAKSGVHSMARTTGYTATMGVRLLLSGKFGKKGVYYPEEIGKEEAYFDFILKGLAEKGIQISQNTWFPDSK